MNDSNIRLIGVLSYITIIGWIIAMVMHSNNRSEFGAFHLRQSLGLLLTGFVFGWIPVLGLIAGIIILVFLIIGLVYAVRDEQTTVPLVGEFFQQIFRGIN
jgi:uncharacterized membrane protein